MYLAVVVLLMGVFPVASIGLAGALHLRKGDRNTNENIGMVSDLFFFLVLVLYLAATIFKPA